MSKPGWQSLFVYPRTSVGIPEQATALATLSIVAQAMSVFANRAVLSDGFAWVFVSAGSVAFFGSLGLAIWRKSRRWALAFAVTVLCWLAAFIVAYGMAVSRMH